MLNGKQKEENTHSENKTFKKNVKGKRKSPIKINQTKSNEL